MAINLETLRKESHVSYSPLPDQSLFIGKQIVTELEKNFKARGVTISIKQLPKNWPAAGQNLYENPYLPLETTSITKEQLESILLMAPGFKEIEIGQTTKPVSVHEFGSSDPKTTTVSLLVTFMKMGKQSDLSIISKNETRGPWWYIYALEENGNAILLGNPF